MRSQYHLILKVIGSLYAEVCNIDKVSFPLSFESWSTFLFGQLGFEKPQRAGYLFDFLIIYQEPIPPMLKSPLKPPSVWSFFSKCFLRSPSTTFIPQLKHMRDALETDLAWCFQLDQIFAQSLLHNCYHHLFLEDCPDTRWDPKKDCSSEFCLKYFSTLILNQSSIDFWKIFPTQSFFLAVYQEVQLDENDYGLGYLEFFGPSSAICLWSSAFDKNKI